MFIHNLKYSLKVLFKNKGLIFWTFVFPIILGTLFKMAFSNIENEEKLSVIDLAVIKNSEFDNDFMFSEGIKMLSDKESSERLFNVKYVSLDEAKKLLLDEKISGYILLDEGKSKIFVNKSDFNSTIIKFVVDNIESKKNLYNVVENYSISHDMYDKYYLFISNVSNESKVMLKDISNNNLSYTNIEYYTLIAMTALYGGMLSLFLCNKHQPNINVVCKRSSVSGIKKSTLIMSNLLASYIVEVLGIFVVLSYTLLVLNADFGSNLLLIILLTLIGAISGLSIGVFISTLKIGDKEKTGVLIAFTMFSSLFAGMYGVTMKYVIDKNIPIINKINPTSLITDGFYSLYYYNTYSRYMSNLVILLIISVLLITISVCKLRRDVYDSV